LTSRRVVRGVYVLAILGLLLGSYLAVGCNIHIVSGAGGWWDVNWQYRKSITIDHTKVSATLTNFPVLVDITDSELAAHAQSNGNDIVFVDYAGNKLNHEIEFFDSVTGRLVAWVNVPTLSSVSDTVLYMYYGNPSASNQQNVAGTWDSNYVMVQHLNQATGAFIDSTGYNNGTPNGGITRDVTGKVDGAASFNGASGYVTLPFELSPPYTVEFWANPTTLSQIGVIFSWGTTDSGNGVSMGIWGPTSDQILIGNSAYQYGLKGVSTYLTAGTWAYWCDAVTTASNIAFYLNGAQKTLSNQNNWFSNQANHRTIGARYYNGYSRFWSGAIDEVRISNIVRSAAWVSTGYNNEQSPSSFYSVAPEETLATPNISNLSPLNGTTGVSTSLSELSFNLANTRNDAMNYSVTTNPNIGSGQGSGVYNGAYSVSVSGLQLDTTYTWQVCAIDPLFGIWNNQTFSFKTIGFYGNWWDGNWSYRKAIVIDHTLVSASLTNFPVLIDITDTDLANRAQTSGNDIVFADGYGNKLNHEIEFYNGATGRLIAWVEVPSLSAVSDTLLYMYFGNPTAANQQSVVGTWDSNYVMVQHLGQATGALIDSTGYHNDGTLYGGVSQNVSGEVDGAARFDGINGYVDLGNAASLQGLTSQLTLEAWVYLPVFNAVNETQLLYKIGGTANGGQGTGFELKVSFFGNLVLKVCSSSGVYSAGSAAGKVSLNTWQFVVGTFNTTDDELRTYINGALADTQPGPTALPSTTYNATLAGWPPSNGGPGYYGQVTMDEARFSNVARSAGWISTEYNNQQSPSSFCNVGPVETFSLEFPDVSNPSPLNGATGVSISQSELSFNLADYRNDSMNYSVTTSPNIGSGEGVGVYSGPYSVGVSGLQLDTTYTWQVCAMDPLFGIWNNQTFSFKTISDLEITSASPATMLELERRSQQTFQVSYIIPVDTTWYVNGLQQQLDYGLRTASWSYTFNSLGIFNVTALGSYGGLTARHEWSVQVVINFSGGAADRVRTDFVASQPWEQGWVYDEQVWYDNDFSTYFMFYSGGPIGQRKFGFAWSTNGLNWTKDAENPIMSPLGSGTWEGSDIYWAMNKIKINGTYWIYYEGGDNAAGLAFLNIASDGNGGYTIANLTRYSGNPIWTGTMEFCCARVNATFWIGYVGTTTVSCVSSTDGLNWAYVKQDVLLPEGSGWDSSRLYPVLTYIYEGTVYVILSSMVQDGVAYCRVGDWTNLTFSPCNPILPIGASGTWEGGQASGLTFKVDENANVIINSNDTLDCWYLGVQTLGGSGDSGVGFCKINNINGIAVNVSLEMTPSNVDCRKYNEYFTIQVNVTNAITMDGFNFTIYYNPTMMSYVSVSWGELGSGTITSVDQTNGILAGYVAGAPITGSRWLLNITFQDIATMIWKQGQVNELDGQIWFHNASLSFSGVQQLVYQEGRLGQVSVNNVGFTFMPIQGDLENSGVVSIADLRTVAAYYDVKQGDPLWSVASAYDLNGNGMIDLYDLVLVGANIGFSYP